MIINWSSLYLDTALPRFSLSRFIVDYAERHTHDCADTDSTKFERDLGYIYHS